MRAEAKSRSDDEAPAVETARMTVIRSLRNNGWKHDALCQQIQLGDKQMSGPSYLSNPAGVICAVTESKQVPLNGEFIAEKGDGTKVTVTFRNGGVI